MRGKMYELRSTAGRLRSRYGPDRNVFVPVLYLHWSVFVPSLGFGAVCILMAFPQEIWLEEM